MNWEYDEETGSCAESAKTTQKLNLNLTDTSMYRNMMLKDKLIEKIFPPHKFII